MKLETNKARHLADMLFAYFQGERIQIKIVNEWKDIQGIESFKSFNNEFRIYKEPKLVPLTRFDLMGEFKDQWLRLKDNRDHWCKISAFNDDYVYIGQTGFTYKEIFDKYTFENNRVCGKFIEE